VVITYQLSQTAPIASTANSGNGGNGTNAGASGVVKIAYPGVKATGRGGTITGGSGYIYHTFTQPGTYTG
jgi:hypothetical protein